METPRIIKDSRRFSPSVTAFLVEWLTLGFAGLSLLQIAIFSRYRVLDFRRNATSVALNCFRHINSFAVKGFLVHRTALGFGIVLILVGVGFYFGTRTASGFGSWTALIPSIIGFLLAICGILGSNELRRKHAMHAAAAIALLGSVACFDGVIKSLRLLSGAVVVRPEAQYEKALTAFICAAFVVLCIRSFADARRKTV